jgi:hypothetical protein
VRNKMSKAIAQKLKKLYTHLKNRRNKLHRETQCQFNKMIKKYVISNILI